ncbi:DUF397 domain-containing protein [Amycolatopsis nigrescens]|uniref:DUF397 domain-containing protein n=1 Tax=Amycolatopsis nigrescens TaxID=381445 RepID=UPI00037A38D0|nr:DUF397 domain-containing protein [Amycolatopsis nigrescens]
MPVSAAKSFVDLSAAIWRKSSYSGSASDDGCVEVAFAGPAVAVRDSKAPGSGALVLPAPAWARFVAGMR